MRKVSLRLRSGSYVSNLLNLKRKIPRQDKVNYTNPVGGNFLCHIILPKNWIGPLDGIVNIVSLKNGHFF